MSSSDRYLTAADLADRLGVETGTVLGWYRGGKIPGHKLSHKVLRFTWDEVITSLESRAPRRKPQAVGQ